MSVKITNAIIQNGDVTRASAQFVVTGDLSQNERLAALSTLVQHAAASLDLPHDGPLAAEILYRIADERAGAVLPIDLTQGDASASRGVPVWRERLYAVLFWGGLTAVIGTAVALKLHPAL